MIFTSCVRVLCLALAYVSFTPLQAVRIADDPSEVCGSSEKGDRLDTLLEILSSKNHDEIAEILKDHSVSTLINTVAVTFLPMGKVVSRLPLIQAIIDGDPIIVEMLLNAGANPLCKVPNYGNITPLHLVASYNSEKQCFMHTCPRINSTISPENARAILKLFIAKIPKDSIDCFCGNPNPMSALFYAAVWGSDYEITKRLVQAGAKVFRKDSTAKLLPERAIIQGNLQGFQALYDTWRTLNPNDGSRDTKWKTLQKLADEILNQR